MHPWRVIVFVYGLGVLAAAQLGKLAPLLSVLCADTGSSLPQAAWLASWIEVGGAGLGVVAGLAVARVGERRALAGGCALLLLGGAGLAMAGSIPALFLWRSVEALGYLVLVVAAPSIIAGTATAAERPVAMALWSTFVPVGMALGIAVIGPLASAFSWRTALGGCVPPLVLATVGATILAVRSGPASAGRGLAGPGRTGPGMASRFAGEWPARAVWLLAAGFFFYTAFEVGLMVLLPTYLMERFQCTTATAATVTGAGSLSTVLGGALAAAAMRRGCRDAVVLAVGLLPPAGFGFLLFAGVPVPASWSGVASDLTPDLAKAIALALGALVLSGIVPAVVFARLPRLAGGGHRTTVGNGVLAQAGAAGALIGPPMCAGLAEGPGWNGVACAILGMALGSLVLLGMAVGRDDAPITEAACS